MLGLLVILFAINVTRAQEKDGLCLTADGLQLALPTHGQLHSSVGSWTNLVPRDGLPQQLLDDSPGGQWTWHHRHTRANMPRLGTAIIVIYRVFDWQE
jgi:hypothetical protein